MFANEHRAPVSTPKRKQRNGLSADESSHLASLQRHIDRYGYPVIVLDHHLWPMMLNDPLRNLLSDQEIWKRVCEALNNIVQHYELRYSISDFTELFTVDGRSFIAMGSISRNDSGRYDGAIVHLSEMHTSVTRFLGKRAADEETPLPFAGNNSALQSEFTRWLHRRDVSRRKIAELTRREHEVTRLVAGGSTNRLIAEDLGICVKTVEKHRASAVKKLGARGTADLVRIAVETGLYTGDSTVN